MSASGNFRLIRRLIESCIDSFLAKEFRVPAVEANLRALPLRIFVALAVGLSLVPLASSSAAARDCYGEEYRVRIDYVIDADTVIVRLPRYGRQKIRLLGIDAPEMTGRERRAGIRARNALIRRIGGRSVNLCLPFDSYGNVRRGGYGRLLGSLHLDGENLGLWLVRNGYARKWR